LLCILHHTYEFGKPSDVEVIGHSLMGKSIGVPSGKTNAGCLRYDNPR
jgi:hypothetical protein